MSAGSVSPARRAAHAVVRRTLAESASADRAFHGEAQGLDPRDRALAKRIAFGAVQRRGTLDWVAGRYSRGALELCELQAPGGRRMPAADWLRGLRGALPAATSA